MKKILMTSAFVTVFLLVLSASYTPVSAYTKRTRSLSTFNQNYEHTLYLTANVGNRKNVLVGEMIFGFDTFAVDEDYCWVHSNESKFQASLINGKGGFSTTLRNPGTFWAKKEINHKGDETVYFTMFLQETYTSTSVNEYESHVKNPE